MGKDRTKEGGFSNFSSCTNTQVCSNFLRREYFSQGFQQAIFIQRTTFRRESNDFLWLTMLLSMEVSTQFSPYMNRFGFRSASLTNLIMIPSGHTTPPPLPLTIQLAFPQKCLFTLLVADIRLVLRLSCRLFRQFPFLPSEVQLLPPPDRLSPQILSAVLCSSNFVVSPDVFGQEDVSVSPAPGNSLPQKKKKKKNTHTSGIILEKYYPVPSFPTYTRWNEHFEGARFFYPCVMQPCYL